MARIRGEIGPAIDSRLVLARVFASLDMQLDVGNQCWAGIPLFEAKHLAKPGNKPDTLGKTRAVGGISRVRAEKQPGVGKLGEELIQARASSPAHLPGSGK